jgi:uncharacterized protein YjgD (DUF1641 family)
MTATALTTTEQADLAQLHAKVDRLTELMEAQHERQQALEDLQQDLIPIANQAIKLTIDELAEIGTEFRVEDLLFLLKRLLRSTDLLNRMLDQLEAVSALGDETAVLGKQVFGTVVENLDRLERRGAFAFARSGMYVMDQILSEFDEEDVRALGDNIVTILKTVRNMTQPDVMNLANNAVQALQQEDGAQESTSLLALAREFSDPKVRRGLARMLNMLKALADQSPSTSPN